ncbi:MAG TPA: hypothetical protein VMB21_21115 [Candidatus Limnocylindria bacterium]|nr:hypothetical protein [Candidatus Limnocylindria bacterium]
MKLFQLSLILGLGMVLSHSWALLRPASATRWLRGFPRNIPAGFFLMLLATAWFEWNLMNETLDDIAPYKNILIIFFPLLGVACCFYAQDYLAVRGLTVVLLLLAFVTCETARWHPSLWRDALTGWAYVWVLSALWLSVQPWRLRNWIGWLTATEDRLKRAAMAGLAWGLLITTLGVTVFR